MIQVIKTLEHELHFKKYLRDVIYKYDLSNKIETEIEIDALNKAISILKDENKQQS